MNIRDTLFFIVVVEAKVDVKSISKKVFAYTNKGKNHQKQLIGRQLSHKNRIGCII